MRKLKLQLQISLDGYIAGPNGEQDWMSLDWGDDINSYIDELTRPVDTIVLGRKLAEGFIPYWARVAADSENPEQESGKKFTETPKVVFTNTLTEHKWDNTTLVKGNITNEVYRLKKQDGNDIIAYGGASFVSSLIKYDLIDEYYLFVNPTAIGRGMAIFSKLENNRQLSLSGSRPFDCGIVVLNYKNK